MQILIWMRKMEAQSYDAKGYLFLIIFEDA